MQFGSFGSAQLCSALRSSAVWNCALAEDAYYLVVCGFRFCMHSKPRKRLGAEQRGLLENKKDETDGANKESTQKRREHRRNKWGKKAKANAKKEKQNRRK